MSQPKNRKKKLQILILTIILFVVLREMGIIKFNYYRRNLTYNITSSWKNDTRTDKFSYSEETGPGTIADECWHTTIPKNISVVAKYANNKYAIKADTCKEIVVELSTFDPGIIWTPLIKYTKFNATADINVPIFYRRTTGNVITRKEYIMSGRINITGHLSFMGVCSYKEARRTILDSVLKQLAENVKEQLLKFD